MHYYQFNIGDYASHTSRLSTHEDIAYRRLLDLYYLNERPLNGCSTDVAREIGMLDSLGDVEYILGKFFEKDGDLWKNKRCDIDIKAYQGKRKSASKAGKASAEARRGKAKEQTLNDRSTDVQPTINQEPRTKNQEPVTINQEPQTKNQQSNPEDQNTMPSKLDGGKNILHHLNIVTGKAFKPVASNLKLITARLKEGHTEAEIIAVIDRKCSEWMHDDKMKQYLRPSTLFNAEKFNAYVGELGVETPEQARERKLEDWVNGTTPQENVIEGEVLR